MNRKCFISYSLSAECSDNDTSCSATSYLKPTYQLYGTVYNSTDSVYYALSMIILIQVITSDGKSYCISFCKQKAEKNMGVLESTRKDAQAYFHNFVCGKMSREITYNCQKMMFAS